MTLRLRLTEPSEQDLFPQAPLDVAKILRSSFVVTAGVGRDVARIPWERLKMTTAWAVCGIILVTQLKPVVPR